MWTSHSSMAWLALALLACGGSKEQGADSQAQGSFSCGLHGGSCAADDVCVLSPDGCSSCVPVPASCDSAACGCLEEGWTELCLGAFTCSDDSGGLELTCSTTDFVCG
jgi:hypothetical protein